MVGQQVKLPHMGALICLVTLALFLQTGPWPFGVPERILVAVAFGRGGRGLRGAAEPEPSQKSFKSDSRVESSLTV